MLISAPELPAAPIYPDATLADVVIRDRVHEDAHLLLWCIEGAVRLDVGGRSTRVEAGQAVLVAAGTTHSVATETALVYPVFLPADQVTVEIGATGRPCAVSPALANALLLLTVAATTELTPSADRVNRLAAVVAELSAARADGPESPEPRLPLLPVSHIPWVSNEHDAVVIWCVTGQARIAVRGNADRSVELLAGQALVVPPGIVHRVLGASGGVILPVFIDPRFGPEGLTLVRVDRGLGRALHAQNLADTSLLGPPGWDGRTVAMALSRSFSADVGATLGAARICAVQQRLLAEPGARTSVGELAHELGVSVRSLERDFAAATGETLRSWRSRLRMSAAADALLGGDRPHVVAKKLGFAHQSALTRAFLRHYGVAPREFARSHSAAR